MLGICEGTQRVNSWLLLFEATAGSFKTHSVFDKQRERRDPQFLVVVVEVCVVCYVVFHYVTHDAHHSQTHS